MTPKPLPEWIEKERPSRGPSLHAQCGESKIKLIVALEIAWEALELIEQRKLEDLPNDKRDDEFHKTLMATAAWFYCGYRAKEAMRRIEGLERE